MSQCPTRRMPYKSDTDGDGRRGQGSKEEAPAERRGRYHHQSSHRSSRELLTQQSPHHPKHLEEH